MSSFWGRIKANRRISVYGWLAIVAILVAVARIVVSYHEISVTWDEPAHIACGIQWLDQGKYTLETLHPPMSRLPAAILPFIAGSRSHSDTNKWAEGDKIIYDGGHYWRTLTLARLGVLPYFILSAFLLWSWCKRLYGEWIASFTVLFYSLLPPVLSSAGLATTDYPLTAAFLASCYAFWWWIQAPNRNRSIILGIIAGLSIATKFSFLVFFPVAAAVIAANEFFVNRKQKLDSALFRAIGIQLVLAFFAAFITVWACYRFSFGPLPVTTGQFAHTAGPSYPMPEFFDGLDAIFNKSENGHAIYFMGKEQKNHGSLWYFPVLIALKTPIAFLILAFIGAALIFFRKHAFRAREFLKSPGMLPLGISAVLLGVVLPSNINLGIRHILPIYLFLSMLAALGARWLITLPKSYGFAAFAVLLVWMGVSSFSCGNDRIAYFNELAGPHPEHFVIAFDLDMGQDIDKLSDTLRANQAKFASIYYFGSADLAKSGLPETEWLAPSTPPNANWVAISKEPLYMFDGYEWLQKEQPFEKIGNSMLLYHFSDQDLARIRAELHSPNIADLENTASRQPSADTYWELSSAYYKAKRYSDCIIAARKALVLKPDFADAYNNIAVGFQAMNQWDSSIAAATQAVRLRPDLQIMKNNLAIAIKGKAEQQENLSKLEKIASDQPTAENYFNLSVAYYQASQFENCISAARNALKLNPSMASAYNNICAAYNSLGLFQEAMDAGQEAVQLDPNSQLAKNNLNWSVRNLSKK